MPVKIEEKLCVVTVYTCDYCGKEIEGEPLFQWGKYFCSYLGCLEPYCKEKFA
jgi:hypothetical protein